MTWMRRCMVQCLPATGLFLATSGAAANPPDLPEDISLWDQTVTLRGGVGYKDNLLLSKVIREHSPFEVSAVELSIFRLPIDGPQVNFFTSFEDTRYWEGQQLDKEQFLASQFQIKQELSPRWTGKLTLEYVYQDQVIDASDTLPSLGTVKIIGHTFNGGPALRYNLTEQQWLEQELTVTRQYFAKPLDDYWAGAGKLTWGINYGNKSEFTVSYEISQRVSDSALETDVTGVAIPGTTLEYLRQRAELTWRHNWDPQRHWRTVTRLAYTANRDNSAGFYDFNKYQFSQQLRYVTKAWEVRAQAKLAHFDYPVQTVDPAVALRRHKSDVNLGLRLERNLGKSFKIFGEYEFERAISNRKLEEYVANTVTAGIEWEF